MRAAAAPHATRRSRGKPEGKPRDSHYRAKELRACAVRVGAWSEVVVMRLIPCARCERHVQVDAAATVHATCPFCGALQADDVLAREGTAGRWRLHAVTAAALATGLSTFAGCDFGTSTPAYGLPCPDDGDCVYTPPDASADARVRADATVDAGPSEDARTDARPNARDAGASDAGDASNDAPSE